jgi:hypothetical protein
LSHFNFGPCLLEPFQLLSEKSTHHSDCFNVKNRAHGLLISLLVHFAIALCFAASSASCGSEAVCVAVRPSPEAYSDTSWICEPLFEIWAQPMSQTESLMVTGGECHGWLSIALGRESTTYAYTGGRLPVSNKFHVYHERSFISICPPSLFD